MSSLDNIFNNNSPFLQVSTLVTAGCVSNLLSLAFEGGSNYWYTDLEEGHVPDGVSVDFFHVELPVKGGTVLFVDKETEIQHTLDQKTIVNGLQVMAERYPEHWADVLRDDGDANTGDVFLQCCIFGELVYG